MAYETFSPEEVDGIVYRASPKVAPTTPAQSTPMQTAPLPSGPVKPPKAKAAEPNVSSLVQNVAEAVTTKPDGYHLTAHIKKYYQTTLV